jgi:hypothetical protein
MFTHFIPPTFGAARSIMRIRSLSPLLLVIGLLGLTTPMAAQGTAAGYVKEFGTMWTFDAPPLDYWKATYDFVPPAGWLDHVRLASVRLPNCSASFVSSQGLVMTNHHCARSCITAASPADTNYMETGFVSAGLQDERKCPGLYVDQLQTIEDVTAKVQRAVTASTPEAEAGQRAAVVDKLEKECASAPDLNCQVVTLFNGGRYSLYQYRRFSDLRLVMAPEESISFFGGDPDNFTYPRYDLDLSLLRVYQDDKPYQPRDFLSWSDSGAVEGDVVFVIGNPGSTGRLLTVAQMEYLRDVTYPAQLAGIARQLAVLKPLAASSEAAMRTYDNTIFGLENAQKAIKGYRRGLVDSTILARKTAFERDFRARIMAKPNLRREYGTAWDAIGAAETALRRDSLPLRWYGFGGSQLLNLAGGLVRIPVQAALPDSLRLPQYRGAGLDNARKQVVAPSIEFDMLLEQKLLAAQLTAAAAELPASDPFLRAVLAGRTPDAAASALLTGTRLADPAVRKGLVDGGAAAVRASTDPLIVVARAIDALATPVGMRQARQNAAIEANAARIGRAIFDAYGTSLPPDATFTLRISDGVVKGFPMNGTIAPYRTSFYGLYGRSAEFGDKAPFHLPERWKQAEARLDLSAPLDFVTTNDIIGGNSGSPVINASGQVVGLIFDGNIEMLPNRFIFTDEVARSVSVHSVAITEALRHVYGADRIANELTGR